MNGSIQISADSSNRISITTQFNKALNANEQEKVIADHFITLVQENHPSTPLHLERRSENYLSLCYNRLDLVRFKYTERTKWISIDALLAKVSADNPLFEAQKNKRVRHWKAKLENLAILSDFDDIVVTACKNIPDSYN